jgi:DNA invertase Pin-like site-specific DNA recombinase
MRLADILHGEAVELSAEGQSIRQFLAYARVSTDDQERAGLSIPAQLREMHECAQARGIAIVETFQEAESAFSEESRRPEFWRMIERAKRDPQITGILVHDHSRFYRDPYAGPQVKGELLAHGVRVYSATEPE